MKIIIIGGSHAGIACARRAREEYPNSDIVIIEKKAEISFVSQTIPLFLMDKENILEQGCYTNPEELALEGIAVLVEHEVKSIDTKSKKIVYINRKTGSFKETNYDKLVMATGSKPTLPMINGIFRETFFLLKDKDDAKALKDFMESHTTVTIIGGGIIGCEIARILAKHGMKVCVLQARDHLMNRYLDSEISHLIEKSLTDLGINVLLKTRAINYRAKKSGFFVKPEVIVETDTGKKFKADGIVISVGFKPNTYLLRGQVDLGDKGGIIVDEYMRTTMPDVFAIGDCSTSYFNLLGGNFYNPHASDAIRQGEIAALNLIEPKQKIPCSLGTYNLNMEDFTVAVTGITRHSAKHRGYDADSVWFNDHYLDEKSFAYLHLVYEKYSHTILGFQVVGNTHINEYANIFSLAIQKQMTIEEIEFSDFYFEHGHRDPSGFTKQIAKKIREKNRIIKKS